MKRTFLVLVIFSVLCLVMYLSFYQGDSSFTQRVLNRFNQLDVEEEFYNSSQIDPKHVENLPDVYLNTSKFSRKSKCGRFPEVLEIHFKNDHWQLQEVTNGTFALLNAYMDYRFNTTKIRIIGMLDIMNPPTYFCQIWYNTSEPVVVPTEKLIYTWVAAWGGAKNGWYQPYIITCTVPQDYDDQIPISVSVVENKCGKSTNNLRVNYRTSDYKEDFVVCVKGLDFPYEDRTTQLVEWVETLRLLGAQKINFYEFHVHPNVNKILKYYQKTGFVEVTPLTVLGEVSNHPFLQKVYLKTKTALRRLQEVIPYNDCLYKHLDLFNFIVVLDTDEIILPSNGTWPDLIEQVTQKVGIKTSYMARNVYFFDSFEHRHEWVKGIPKYFHMLQHVQRAKEFSKPGAYAKGFHRTDAVVAQHNHFPFNCYKGCKSVNMGVDQAQMQHYRKDCVKEMKNCDALKKDGVTDTGLWRFKDEIITRVKEVLLDVGYLVDEDNDDHIDEH